MQDHLRRASQVSSALESRLRQEGRAEAHAQAQAQMQALKQGRAEAQAAAHKQIQALLQERDDLQVAYSLQKPPHRTAPYSGAAVFSVHRRTSGSGHVLPVCKSSLGRCGDFGHD